MADSKQTDEKMEALREDGCLNRHPERIEDELFAGNEYFDPRDLVQVRYEMLRRVRLEGQTVSRTAAEFGFSRPTFYHAQRNFEQRGLAGLIPKKPGPQGPHKLTEEVVNVLVKAQGEDPPLRPEDMVDLVWERFRLKVHPRSVERALKRVKKNA